MASLGGLGLRRHLLRGLRAEVLDELVAVGGLRLGVLDPLHRPLALRALPLLEPVALGDELVVALLLLAPGQLAGRDEVGPSAGVLDGVVVRAAAAPGCASTVRSRNVRSCDTTTTAAGVAVHEPLELVEPGEVEVVGGLVEQQHVLLRQQDRRQRRPRGLSAAEVADGDVEPVSRQSRPRRAPCRCAASRSSPPRAR